MKHSIKLASTLAVSLVGSATAQEFDLFLNEYDRPTDYREQIVDNFDEAQKAMVYLGMPALGLMADLDTAIEFGWSDDWTVARGTTLNESVSCLESGGYDFRYTRDDFRKISGRIVADNCGSYGYVLNGSIDFQYNDDIWLTESLPRIAFPLTFNFNDLQIRGGDGLLYSYSGQLQCDSEVNAGTRFYAFDFDEGKFSLTFRAPTDADGISWDVDNLSRDFNGNVLSSTLGAYFNCDFKNVSVSAGENSYRIDGLKFVVDSFSGPDPDISFSPESGFAITTGRDRRLSLIDSGSYESKAGLIEASSFFHGRYGDYFLDAGGGFGGSPTWAQGIMPSESALGIDYVIVIQPTTMAFNYWSFVDDRGTRSDEEDSAHRSTLQSTNSIWQRSYCGRQCAQQSGSQAWPYIVYEHSDCREGPFSCSLVDVFYSEPFTSAIRVNDNDSDGSVDEVDLDDDNDGQTDLDEENCGSSPYDAKSVSDDYDADSTPNCVDSDDDNDGVLDESDAFPLDENESQDSDSDGLGDNLETSVGLDPLNPDDVTGSPREILWRNSVTGANTLWSLESQYVVERNSLIRVADPQWKVEGLANFTGDSSDEVFFRHHSRGENRLWVIDEGKRTESIAVPGAHPDWVLAVIGDFDGDGDADLLWRNSKNGTNRYWEMNGASRVKSVAVRGVALSWQIVGSGDFDDDGSIDLMWRNLISGANTIWLMNGESIKVREQIPSVSLDWTVVGVADFDADGMDDLLWRNKSGANSIWLMDGTERESTPLPGASSDWEPFGVYDLNGDDIADILWRNKDGSNRVWLVNETFWINSVPLKSVSDNDWSPVAVGNVSN